MTWAIQKVRVLENKGKKERRRHEVFGK